MNMISNSQVMDNAEQVDDEFSRPAGARMALFTMLAGCTVLIVWAYFAQIDQVTRAPAQIIAIDRTQLIQSSEGGVVTHIHVKEGDVVKTGQPLVTLEKERAQAAVNDSTAKTAALKAALARLEAEVYGKPLVFPPELLTFSEYIRNQTALYNRRQTAFNEDIASLQGVLNIAKDELEINQKLLKTGDVSRAEVLRLHRSVADINSQIATRRNKYFQDAQADMTKAQEDLNTQKEQLRDRSQLLEHTELVAPANGIVNSIKTTTLGAVLRPGDVAMELLPTSGSLLAETKISPTDIAFVKVGQTAFVKIDAFDSSIFGGLTGEVSYISPDVLKEDTRQGPTTYYRVHIQINAPLLKGINATVIQLRPGMTATVEIKARERSILSFLTKPIIQTLGNSMGER